MDLMKKVRAKAKANPVRVAFPEAGDPKMLAAIDEVVKDKCCTAVIVGNPNEIKKLCKENKINDKDFEYIDNNDEDFKEKLLNRYLKLPNLIYGEKSLRRRMTDPLYTALMMEALDDVDVTFGGFFSSSGDFILAAQTIVGLEDNLDIISSVGIAEIPDYTFSDGGHLVAVGDCAVATNPSASELASIAISTCDTVKAVTDWEPRCAMLSYSTDGSGTGELVDKVLAAVKIANEKRPDLLIDGEFQLDSAIKEKVKLQGMQTYL